MRWRRRREQREREMEERGRDAARGTMARAEVQANEYFKESKVRI